MRSALIATVALLWGLSPGRAVPGNLLTNPGFDDDLASWTIGHTWYVGDGDGLSEITIDDHALCITGTRNRAIAIQALPAYPDVFRIAGRIRCQGLEGAQALINVEWKRADGSWISGEAAGSVTGDSDWVHVQKLLLAPPDTETVFVEVMTNAPNSGKAWFDDLVFEDTTTDDVPPAPLDFEVGDPGGLSGAVLLKWDPEALERDVLRIQAFVDEAPFTTVIERAPAASARPSAGSMLIEGLTNGREYCVAAIAIDQDGNRITEVTPERVTPVDNKPPRPVLLEVESVYGATGGLWVTWDPHPLDLNEIDHFTLLVRSPASNEVSTIAIPAGRRQELVPDLSEPTVDVAVLAVDAAGNRLEPEWVMAHPPYGVVAERLTLRALGEHGAELDATFKATPVDQPGPPVRLPGPIEPGVYRVIASAEGHEDSAPVLMLLGEGAFEHTFALRPRGVGGLRLWAVDALKKVFRDDVPPEGPADAIRLLSGRNESESAQIVVRADEDIAQVRVWASHLVHEDGKAVISADHIRASFVGYVLVERNSKATPPEELVRPAPAEFPDELLEEGALPLQAGRCQPVYLRVRTPADAKPGIYSGRVHVDSGDIDVSLPIEVEVLPVDFPDLTRLLVTNWFDTSSIASEHGVPEWSEDHWAWLAVYARAMADHHQNVAMVPLGLIEVFEEEDGGFAYDFRDFDRFVELFDAAGLGARIEISHLGGRATGEWECPEFVFHPRPATRRADGTATTVPVPDFMRALQEHLRERGWLARAMQHVADEPIPANEASWRELARTVKAAAPDLRRIDAIHVTDLDGDVEVWVPQLNFFDEAYDALRAKQEAGIAEVWFYIAWVPQGKYPNRLIDMATMKTRLPHWLNYLYGAPGYLHWGLNWWRIEFGHFSPGDEWIIWPGARGPRSSLRYEAQREGIEDYEYLMMLEDLMRAAGEDDPSAKGKEIMGTFIRSVTDYEKDPAALQAARAQILRRIAALSGG